MLNIDDRLAKLAEVATRYARRPGVINRAHDRRLAVAPDPHHALSGARALELTGSLIEGLATGDADLLESICSASIHARTPTTDTSGIGALTDSVSIGQPAFTDVEVDLETLLVVDRTIAAEWRLHATHTGPLTVDWAVIEATGQRIVLVGGLVAHLELNETTLGAETVFDDIHLSFDTTSLLMQLALT